MNDKSIKGNLSDTPFNIVLDSNVLAQNEFEKLIPLKDELVETFAKSQLFRTRTEMEVSVLNSIKFPTASSKFWQATKEQNVMFQELVMLSYEYRKNIVEIKKLKRDIISQEDDLEIELLEIEIEKKIFTSKNQEKTAKDRIREILQWSEIKARESKNMNEEELENVDNHQLVSYTRRWINQSIAMGGGGSPAERQNLLGQLRSAVSACIEKGLIDDILKDYNKDIKNKIRKEYDL